MVALSFIFWLLLALLFYSYIGYGLIVWLVTGFYPRKKKRAAFTAPPITIVIACYNEAKLLAAKIDNTLSLQYPAPISIIVVDDGSTDQTKDILLPYKNIRLISQPRRTGKPAAMNLAMQSVSTPLVVFSDANCLLSRDSLEIVARHFADAGTGAVAGEKRIRHSSGMGDAEGWYWEYESLMKQLDASLYSAIGATGELFAIRSELYRPLPEDMILDDFILSMIICHQGYRIAYEKEAYAIEGPSKSLAAEEKRKVRIAAGAFQALRYIAEEKLLHNALFRFQFFSRRWLRWVVCPFAVVLLFILNILLSIFSGNAWYDYLLVIQLLFYIAAGAGWILLKRNRSLFLTTVPFYFLFMNFCMIKGFLAFLRRRHTVLWTKAER